MWFLDAILNSSICYSWIQNWNNFKPFIDYRFLGNVDSISNSGTCQIAVDLDSIKSNRCNPDFQMVFKIVSWYIFSYYSILLRRENNTIFEQSFESFQCILCNPSYSSSTQSTASFTWLQKHMLKKWKLKTSAILHKQCNRLYKNQEYPINYRCSMRTN